MAVLTTSICRAESFDDVYLSRVFQMDRKALLSIPQLSDEDFIARMRSGRDMLPTGR
jgi:hypothetical protein